MKKLLMMAFVSMALLATVSCSKDDKDDKSEIPSLVGTSWQCVHSFSAPLIGSVSLTMNLEFTSDKICHTELTLPDAIASLVPIDLNGDFEYTFDGKKIVVQTNNNLLGNIELEYVNGTMLIFVIPENYRSTLGTSELIFHKR